MQIAKKKVSSHIADRIPTYVLVRTRAILATRPREQRHRFLHAHFRTYLLLVRGSYDLRIIVDLHVRRLELLAG